MRDDDIELLKKGLEELMKEEADEGAEDLKRSFVNLMKERQYEMFRKNNNSLKGCPLCGGHLVFPEDRNTPEDPDTAACEQCGILFRRPSNMTFHAFVERMNTRDNKGALEYRKQLEEWYRIEEAMEEDRRRGYFY